MSVRTISGDCRTILPTLPADSFDCVVTSPPYWGLRDYGIAGQIGLEPTLEGYIEEMAAVACELWRVLKPSGTFWLNLGDCYAASPTGQKKQGTGFGSIFDGRDMSGVKSSGTHDKSKRSGLKPKDLCMVPARVALRLQADGWWLRSEIIWAKPNPMPESVTDRPTCAHEKLWLLAKSERYFFDAAAIREPGVGREDDAHGLGGDMRHPRRYGADKQRGHSRRHAGFNARWDAMTVAEQRAGGANARNVWTIASQPYSGAHFATMPPALVERCILAGCPKDGHVLDPFGGAGTTGLVADRLTRNATLIELNPAYIDLQRDRIEGDSPLFAEVSA